MGNVEMWFVVGILRFKNGLIHMFWCTWLGDFWLLFEKLGDYFLNLWSP
jgi:hypothetical protein